MDIGEITGLWDYSKLPKNVQLGANCFLERLETFGRFRSRRRPGLILGDRVRVLTWSAFSIEPNGCVVIGEDTILVGAILMCADSIRIGSRCSISYNVTITDSDFHPLDIEARRRDAIAISPRAKRSDRPAQLTSPVVVGHQVKIGTGAIILKGVHIGDCATIAPGAVVAQAVPPNSLASGNPAIITDAA